MEKQFGYCVKCRTKREMKDVKLTTTKGRNYAKGVCKSCNTNMCVITK